MSYRANVGPGVSGANHSKGSDVANITSSHLRHPGLNDQILNLLQLLMGGLWCESGVRTELALLEPQQDN